MVGAATPPCRGSTLGAPPLPELNLPMGRSMVTSKLNSYFYPPQRRDFAPAYSLRAPTLIAFLSVSRAGISEIGRGLIRGQPDLSFTSALIFPIIFINSAPS